MDERIEKWLYDIRLAIDEIDGYFNHENKKFTDFQQNQMLKRAIERNLEIIGEATNRILAKDPNVPISNARKIVNLRNLVIHSYDNISDESIWSIVINNLPELKKDVDKLI
ncbi:antitoxin [Bacteroidia bacterium]|nr:antitoxin [Bacteroidia bacterium]